MGSVLLVVSVTSLPALLCSSHMALLAGPKRVHLPGHVQHPPLPSPQMNMHLASPGFNARDKQMIFLLFIYLLINISFLEGI